MAIYCKILECKLKFHKTFKDPLAKQLIAKLLTRTPHKRLGCLRRGALDIKRDQVGRNLGQ
jgi:hypothetical protein